MSWVVIGAVSLISGLLGSLGMGAGAVLLLYLRIWGGYDQFSAQGINLIFFLPIALLSILLHTRSHLIDWKVAGLCVLSGLPCAWLGVWLGGLLGTELLSKAFALLLLLIGIKEICCGFFQKKQRH